MAYALGCDLDQWQQLRKIGYGVLFMIIFCECHNYMYIKYILENENHIFNIESHLTKDLVRENSFFGDVWVKVWSSLDNSLVNALTIVTCICSQNPAYGHLYIHICHHCICDCLSIYSKSHYDRFWDDTAHHIDHRCSKQQTHSFVQSSVVLNRNKINMKLEH